MDLDVVAEAIVIALSSTGVRGFSEVPQRIVPPAAIVGIGAGDYADSEDHITAQFGVLVLLSGTSPQTAQKDMRAYCQAHGPKSIKAAVESITEADVLCRGWDAPAVIELGGLEFLGVEFTCEAVE